MQNNSKEVDSNQEGVHPDLEWAVRRHLAHAYRRPVAEHTREAFSQASTWLTAQNKPLILDTGCGVGLSTIKLARLFPDCAVIGIDKSEFRLAKADENPSNALFLRADLQDFWGLAHAAGWRPVRHYILYPNPWPKARHFMRRWQSHPVFPTIVALGGIIELRTNWRTYAEEFSKACEWATGKLGSLEDFSPDPSDPLTAFERKYIASGHKFARFCLDLNAD